MINAIFKKKDDKLIGFNITGHAGYAQEGFDIICAAVSALVINTVNSIEKFTEDAFSEESDDEIGNVNFIINGDISKESELLLNSLLLGLTQVSEVNESDFLKVEIKEV